MHVADVPGRHEPGTGEIDYRRIAEVLPKVGHDGVIGMEAFPAGDKVCYRAANLRIAPAIRWKPSGPKLEAQAPTGDSAKAQRVIKRKCRG